MFRDLHEQDFHLIDVIQLRKEPLVDVGHLPNLIDSVASMESIRDREYALVRRVHEFFVDIFDKVILGKLR